MFLFGFSYKLISFNERILPFNFMDAVELQQKEKKRQRLKGCANYLGTNLFINCFGRTTECNTTGPILV